MTEKPILVLSTALAGGGAEEVARLMVNYLRTSACVLFENDAKIVLSQNKKCVAIGYRPRSLFGVLVVNTWRVIVIQFVKLRIRPIITISHLEGPNFANILTMMGGARILFVHNCISKSYSGDGIRNVLRQAFVRILYRRANCIVGVSNDVCSELVESFDVDSKRVLFIPNPIDTLGITEASSQTYGDVRDQLFSEQYLINVGSLTPQKNQQRLIRMFSHLITHHREFNNLRLVLVGEGEQAQYLKKLSIELDLETCDLRQEVFCRSAQVFFTGFMDNPYPLIRHSKLLVMTSLWEGLPITLLEGMSLGIPSVLSDCSDGIRFVWEIPEKSPDLELTGNCLWSRYGALIKELGDDVSRNDLWSMPIIKLLRDQSLYQDCSSNANKRADYFDVSNVSTMWNYKLLKQYCS